MKIKEALLWSIGELKNKDVSEPDGSAALLLANVLGKDRAYIYAHGEEKLTAKQSHLFERYVERRKTHEPVWYIIGEVEFYGRRFYVSNDVLTPRPETELLIEEVLNSVNGEPGAVNQIVELGTGSGIIAITLAKELVSYPSTEAERNGEVLKKRSPQGRSVKIVATDISDKALKVAKKNAKLHGVENQIKFLHGDLLEPLATNHYPLANSLLVANLPYIPNEDMKSLQFDVLHHEPRVALDGGKKGIEIYERLIAQMKEFDFSGMAFFEIGIGQGKLSTNIVQKYFPKAEVEIKKDLANIDRIVIVSVGE